MSLSALSMCQFLLWFLFITLRQLILMVELNVLFVEMTNDIVTVSAKTAPQCSSYQRDVLLPMPSSMNPSGASVKTSPTVLHGRSCESDESDEDLHQEAQVLYILKSQNIESCISICVLVVLKKILVYSNLYVRSSSSKKEQKRSCHSC